MPTGYTEGVAKGEISDFSDYALRCARSFGACIMLRDEPLSSEIPEFEPSDFNAKSLAKAKEELAEFLAMDESQRRELHAEDCTNNEDRAKKRISEINAERKRYEAMLTKAREYESPSSDHDEFAAFLVSQLEESIKWDCDTSYWDGQLREVPFSEWQETKLASLRRSIAYNEEADRDEIERTAGRNEWVRKLKQSLKSVSA